MNESINTNLINRLERGLGKVPFLKISKSEIQEAVDKKLFLIKEDKHPGVCELRGIDLNSIRKVQKEAFKDNYNLCKQDWKMELLYASDLLVFVRNNANLSFAYRDAGNSIVGYLIAYRGIHNNFGDIIYISDWASLDNNIAGGKVLSAFLIKYARVYINNKLLIPIYINAREST